MKKFWILLFRDDSRFEYKNSLCTNFSKKKERKEKKTTIRKIEVSNEIASSILPPPKRHRNFACTAIPNTKQLIWKLQKSDISLAELDRHPIKRPHCFETRGLKRGWGWGEERDAFACSFRGMALRRAMFSHSTPPSSPYNWRFMNWKCNFTARVVARGVITVRMITEAAE